MPNPKRKSENYVNLGGINQKSSQYITNQTEFLNILNADSRTVGSLSTFAGTTQYSSTSTTLPITGLANFYGPGNTAYLIGANTFGIMAMTQSDVCDVTGTTFPSIYHFIYGSNPTPFSTVSALSLYGSNQYDFFNFQGTSPAIQYSLPKPTWVNNATTTFGSTGGLTGTLVAYFAFVRSDGFYGPALGITFSLTGATGIQLVPPIMNVTMTVAGVTLAYNGLSLGSWNVGLTQGLQMWYSINGSLPKGLSTLLGVTTAYLGGPNVTINDQFASFTMSSIQPQDYFGTFLYGFSSGNGASAAAASSGGVTSLVITGGGNNPSTIEISNNQLFSAGFANSPDTVWYSQIGNLEMHDNTGFFSVRPFDGDIVTNMKAYFTELLIFKLNSTHLLSGTDPGNFTLVQVSDQYGCVSSRACCVWEQNCWYLDKKGIMEFNGANVVCTTDKVQPIFDRMNVQAARSQAVMTHVKERNEVWCAIPVDGATFNNLIVVYDYLAQTWLTRTAPFQMTALSLISQGVAKQQVFCGTFSGTLFDFGNSFYTENGAALTFAIKSRFVAGMGYSVEAMWRRLYLDAAIPAGSTYNIAVNMYSNQGLSTPVLQTTMTLSSFQNRIEFGISARDLAVEFIYNGGQFLRINGFTLEYRFQRAV